jgi:Spy/CpxP family protein refolding chaperone
MRTLVVAVLALVLSCSTAVGAETSNGPDPLRDVLPQVDVVMAHQDALGLSEAQKNAIRASVMSAQGRFATAQHNLEDAVAKMVEILRPGRVDQTRVLAQLDVVLAREREIKRTQLTLMVEIKNELTPAQQEMARQFATTGTK